MFKSRTLAYILLLLPSLVFGQATLNEVQLYNRCFTQLTGSSVLTSPLLEKVRKNEVKAIDACIKHLEDTQFNQQGMITAQQPSDISFKILQQIHQIHRSWFKKSSVLDSEVNRDFHWATLDVYDVNESALHFTRVALSPNTHLAEAVNRPTSLQAVRSPARPQIRYVAGGTEPFLQPRVSLFLTPQKEVDGDFMHYIYDQVDLKYRSVYVPTLQVGQLYGIQDRPQNILMASFMINPNAPEGQQLNPGNPEQYPIFKNYGGGVIGSIPYLMTNLGHGYTYVSNGAEKLPRKWSEAVMRDLLCRELPVLRNSDVVQYISNQPSAPQFRKGANCLSCHATMDQMALTARNLRMVASGSTSADLTKYFASIAAYTPKLPAQQDPLWPEVSTPNFNLQNPAGVFYFRNYAGNLVKENVNSIQDLGQAISRQDDYYICAAKKYFQFFTGINVNLIDPASRTEAFYSSPKNLEFRNYVIDLGLDLRSHGSVKRTISRILLSPYYKQTHFGAGGE